MSKFNEAPYHDDFLVADENGRTPAEKNYLKILFKPGLAVQTRELNSLQSAVQAQVSRLGFGVFRDGAPVIGGEPVWDKTIRYIDLDTSEQSQITQEILESLDEIKRGSVHAKVLSVEPFGEDIYRLHLRYTRGNALFENDDDLLNAISNPLIPVDTPIGEVLQTGESFGITVNEGVFFSQGYFVYTENQTRYFAKNSIGQSISGRVALRVVSSFVNSSDDVTLLDNAQGRPNFNATGADRYAIELTPILITNDLTENQSRGIFSESTANTISSIDIFKIQNSEVVTSNQRRFSEIDRTLAQRTFEESGNYCLQPFQIDVLELFSIGKRSRHSELPDGEVEGEKYSVAIDPSVAYVNGYRTELLSKIFIDAEKARDTELVNSVSTATVGNYVEANLATASELPLIQDASRVFEIRDSASASLGTCTLRGLRRIGDVIRLYVTNVNITGDILDAETLEDNNVVFELTSGFELRQTQNETALFELPGESVSQVNSLSYVKRVRIDQGSSGSPATTLTITNPESGIFVSSLTSYFVVDDEGDSYNVTNVNNSTAGTAILTLDDTLPSGRAKTILAAYRITQTNFATASRNDVSDEVAGVNFDNNILTLAEPNLDKLVSIVYDGMNITSEFELIEGQSNTMIDLDVKFRHIGSTVISDPDDLLVSYSHFTYNGNGPWVVDSYEAVPYENISKRNFVDFRLRAGVSSSQVVIEPNSTLIAEFEQYLPRIDSVIVSSDGDFSVIKGVSSTNPVEPKITDNSLRLYNLEVSPFTFNANIDIAVRYIDNSRFTMRDIGDIADTVDNLEQNIELTQLERDTLNERVFDEAGERVVAGVFVDDFQGHGKGDVSNPNYRCAVDVASRKLRSSFKTHLVSFHDSADDAVGDILTLPEDSIVPHITQPFASTSVVVNSFENSRYTGNIILSPSSDEWYSTTRPPKVVLNRNGNFDNYESDNPNAKNWNEWETNWQGSELLKSRFTRRENLGERVSDISIVPFIRSRKVYFWANGLRPSSLVRAYFDGVDITQYTVQDTFTNFRLRDSDEIYDNDTDLPVEVPDINAELTTDADGQISGWFVIPNNENFSFRTGSREFVLSDNIDNPFSFASVNYNAAGLLKTNDSNIPSVRVSQRDIIQDDNEPIAESFVLESDIVAKSLDLYFAQKDTTEPVSIHIVNVENGIPTRNVVPNSNVSKFAGQVNLGAANATTFEFDEPVFLEANREYAIVVSSISQKYKAFAGEIGETDLTTGRAITRNPYLGNFYQNSETGWNLIGNRNLKYRLNRYVFDTSSTMTIDFPARLSDDVTFSTVRSFVESFTPKGTQVELALLVNAPAVRIPLIQGKNISLPIEYTTQDLQLEIKLTSNSDNVSPFIDLDRASVLLIENDVLTSSILETSAGYITREIELENGVSGVDVFASILRPSEDTDIKIFIKTNDSAVWEEVSPADEIRVNSRAFLESQFTYRTNGLFTRFKIKVVTNSIANSAIVPQLDNIRAIASW